MRKIFILFLASTLLLQIHTQEMKRSDKKKLKKALDVLEIVENPKTEKEFKSSFKAIKSALRSLNKKHFDHPKVKKLQEIYIALEKIVPLEKVRGKLEKSIKKLEKAVKKLESGIASQLKTANKEAVKVQNGMLALKVSKKKRFQNTISIAKILLIKSKKMGVIVKNEEDIVKELALEKAMNSLNRSQKKMIAKIEKKIKSAEKKEGYSNIKKPMESVESLLIPLEKVLGENPKIISLRERFDALEEKLIKSKVAFDVKGDISTLEKSISNAKKAKDFVAMKKAMNVAKEKLSILDKKDLTDNEDLEKKIASLEEQFENLDEKFKKLLVVFETKSDIKTITSKIKSGENTYKYEKLKKPVAIIKSILLNLENKSNLQDNEEIVHKVENFRKSYTSLVEKLSYSKKEYELREKLDYLEKETRKIFRAVSDALVAKDIILTEETSKHQWQNVGKNLNKAIVLIPVAIKKCSVDFEFVQKTKNVIEEKKINDFARTITEANLLLTNWKKVTDNKKSIEEYTSLQIKRIYNDLEKEINSMHKKVNSFEKFPSEFVDDFRLFQREGLRRKSSYILNFSSNQKYSKFTDGVNSFNRNIENYITLLSNTRRIRSNLQSTNLNIAKHNFNEAVKIAGKNTEMNKIISFYENYLDTWETANKKLANNYKELQNDLEKSSITMKKSFTKFKTKYSVISANRLSIVNDIEKQIGKAIRPMTIKHLNNHKGWDVRHGNDLYTHILEEDLAQRFKLFYENIKTQFKAHILKIAKEHKIEAKGLFHFRFPGFVNIQMLALVDGTRTHTPRVAVRDRNGHVILWQDGISMQIVKTKVVGFESKYFTFWQNSTPPEIDFEKILK